MPSDEKRRGPCPRTELLNVYHWRWGYEIYYLMLKGGMELENFSGRTVEAVRQDLHGAVLIARVRGC
jgi:hypothetical protein